MRPAFLLALAALAGTIGAQAAIPAPAAAPYALKVLAASSTGARPTITVRFTNATKTPVALADLLKNRLGFELWRKYGSGLVLEGHSYAHFQTLPAMRSLQPKGFATIKPGRSGTLRLELRTFTITQNPTSDETVLGTAPDGESYVEYKPILQCGPGLYRLEFGRVSGLHYTSSGAGAAELSGAVNSAYFALC